MEIEEARLKAQAERSESDANRREAVAENSADEQIIAAQQELEVLRRRCEAKVEQNRLEADSSIVRAESEGERAVQEIAVELRKLKNVSDVTLEADTKRRAAEIVADGQNQAVQIVESTHNDLARPEGYHGRQQRGGQDRAVRPAAVADAVCRL